MRAKDAIEGNMDVIYVKWDAALVLIGLVSAAVRGVSRLAGDELLLSWMVVVVVSQQPLFCNGSYRASHFLSDVI